MIVEPTPWAAVPRYAAVVMLDGRTYVVVPDTLANPSALGVSALGPHGWSRWRVNPTHYVDMLVPELGDALAELVKHFTINMPETERMDQ